MKVEISNDLEQKLMHRYGFFISSTNLWKILSYPSSAAYRKARSRGLLPIQEIEIEGRQGKFVPTAAVADWINTQILKHQEKKGKK